MATSPELAFDLQLAPALPHALADRAQIEQVLGHLVANARDAMQSGGTVTLTSSVGADPRGAPRICIAVRDTGIGMDAETRAKAFDPFFTTRKLTGGRGLGLTTVRGLLAEMRGRAEVESAVGAGTTVRVLLPVTA